MQAKGLRILSTNNISMSDVSSQSLSTSIPKAVIQSDHPSRQGPYQQSWRLQASDNWKLCVLKQGKTKLAISTIDLAFEYGSFYQTNLIRMEDGDWERIVGREAREKTVCWGPLMGSCQVRML